MHLVLVLRVGNLADYLGLVVNRGVLRILFERLRWLQLRLLIRIVTLMMPRWFLTKFILRSLDIYIWLLIIITFNFCAIICLNILSRFTYKLISNRQIIIRNDSSIALDIGLELWIFIFFLWIKILLHNFVLRLNLVVLSWNNFIILRGILKVLNVTGSVVYRCTGWRTWHIDVLFKIIIFVLLRILSCIFKWMDYGRGSSCFRALSS